MVAYQYYAKKGLKYRISSLKKEYRNYYQNSIKIYVPVVIPIPDYSKLDKEIARLEQQENDADTAKAAALQALLTTRAKKDRLRKQKKLLMRREQQ
jgi:hypothetical protein